MATGAHRAVDPMPAPGQQQGQQHGGQVGPATEARPEPEVHLRMTLSQARAVARGLEFYARLCIGQLESVAELARSDVLVAKSQPLGAEPSYAPAEFGACDQLEALMHRAKAVLGFHAHGSLGIGHPSVHLSGRRAWEVRKVLHRAIAVHTNPTPDFPGVDYDGLIVRITPDPAPEAIVQTPSEVTTAAGS